MYHFRQVLLSMGRREVYHWSVLFGAFPKLLPAFSFTKVGYHFASRTNEPLVDWLPSNLKLILSSLIQIDVLCCLYCRPLRHLCAIEILFSAAHAQYNALPARLPVWHHFYLIKNSEEFINLYNQLLGAQESVSTIERSVRLDRERRHGPQIGPKRRKSDIILIFFILLFLSSASFSFLFLFLFASLLA